MCHGLPRPPCQPSEDHRGAETPQDLWQLPRCKELKHAILGRHQGKQTLSLSTLESSNCLHFHSALKTHEAHTAWLQNCAVQCNLQQQDVVHNTEQKRSDVGRASLTKTLLQTSGMCSTVLFSNVLLVCPAEVTHPQLSQQRARKHILIPLFFRQATTQRANM